MDTFMRSNKEVFPSLTLVYILCPRNWPPFGFTVCCLAWSAHRTFISTATRSPPSISFRFSVSSLYNSLSGLGCFVLYENHMQFAQIYVPILSKLISRLYSLSLLFPLGEWPHHTLYSWSRYHLQSQNVFTYSNTFHLLQSPKHQ